MDEERDEVSGVWARCACGAPMLVDRSRFAMHFDPSRSDGVSLWCFIRCCRACDPAILVGDARSCE